MSEIQLPLAGKQNGEANPTRTVPGGIYLTIEGPSCTGKSTQLTLLATHLRNQGYLVFETRQPGGTAIGAAIREVLLRPDLRPQFTIKAEAMLYWADRSHHHETFVKPALAAGAIVLGSRDYDSSYVYQCALRGLDEAWMDTLRKLLIGDFAPTKTIVLMISEHTFRQRSEARKRTSIIDQNEIRVDEQEVQRFAKIREAFLERAEREPQRLKTMEAELGINELAAELQLYVDRLIVQLKK